MGTSQWGYWAPLSQMARLTEEAGELARVLNHAYGEKKKKPDEILKPLEEEVGDALFTLICISNPYKIDMVSAYQRAIQKYSIRDKDRWK
ncbi:MAG: nucleotide pyrophosphohydrolase [archaeon]